MRFHLGRARKSGGKLGKIDGFHFEQGDDEARKAFNPSEVPAKMQFEDISEHGIDVQVCFWNLCSRLEFQLSLIELQAAFLLIASKEAQHLVGMRRKIGQRFLYRPDQHRKFREIRSEEHTSELQSRLHLVCRLLLEKKK